MDSEPAGFSRDGKDLGEVEDVLILGIVTRVENVPGLLHVLAQMKFQRLPLLLLFSLSLLAGCEKQPAIEPTPPIFQIDPLRGHLLHAQSKLPTVKVNVDGHELDAEIAERSIEIATGMMFRTNMPENEAMIFVFSDAAPRSFYMRNCSVPLSGAYITPAGEIFQIIDMQPHDETGIPSQSDNIQFVLEVPQGWFKRHNVSVGASVRTEKGSLQDTFFKGR